MPDRFIESHISQIPLFRNLSPELFKLVGNAFEVRRYNAGEWIFRQGEPTQGLVVLVEGTGILTRIGADRVERTVGYVRQDEILNQDALLSDGLEHGSLYAQDQTTILFLARPRLMTLVAHYPELKTALGLDKSQSHHVHPVKFKGQRENEDIILITRQHWWAYVGRAWLPLIIMIGLWVMSALIPLGALTAIILIISVLGPGILMLYFYLEWRNDSVIITNERVIRITHTILTFKEMINDTPIAGIHEVNAFIPRADLFARLFNYGTLQVRTSGDAGNFELAMIPNPQRIQQIILEDRQHYSTRKALQHRHTLRADLDRVLTNPETVPGQQGGGQQNNQEQNKKVKNRRGFKPFSIRFEMPNGDVVYRRHFMVIIKHILIPLFIWVLTLVLIWLDLFNPIFQSLGVIAWIGTFFVFLVGVVWFYWAYWDWKNDYYLISDSTIVINHERPLFLQSENQQLLLSRIDNVEADTAGLFAQLFNYGDLKVSLTGANAPKTFHAMPKPREVQEEISRRQVRISKRQAEAEADQQRQIIRDYLSLYHEMTGGGQQPGGPGFPDQQQPQPGQGYPQQQYNPPQSPPGQGYPQQQQYSPPQSPPGQGYPQQQQYNPPQSPPGQRYNAPPQQGYQPQPPLQPGQTAQQPPQGNPPPPTDRTRPPGVPRQRKPYLSPGVPYNPAGRDGARPPHIPRVRRPNPDEEG